jgi:small subunit ribosomal protein MRP21
VGRNKMKASRTLQSYARRTPARCTPTQMSICHRKSLPSQSQHEFSHIRQLSSTNQRQADEPKKTPQQPSNFMQSLIDDIRGDAPSPSTTFRQSSPGQQAARPKASTDWAELLSIARRSQNPPSTTQPTSSNPTKTVNSLLSSLDDELSLPHFATPAISLRLKPTLGRTVDGLLGDPTRGFRILERKCTENNVRGDERAQKKHIRRGQMRKNTRMLRWRKLFLQGFKSELNTLHRMRKQGW